MLISYSASRVRRTFVGPSMESPYMSIATMLIESAALYGAWSLVFLILCIQRSPGQTIILATMSQIQVSSCIARDQGCMDPI